MSLIVPSLTAFPPEKQRVAPSRAASRLLQGSQNLSDCSEVGEIKSSLGFLTVQIVQHHFFQLHRQLECESRATFPEI